ncbi:glycosyltransferase [Ligilactobacillus agilis]|uniref:glycosyltransferase n=1 Tax=Ligilactobacillus agilis TaxID=1601 RepID=UPI00191F03C9|nr:glycosyltransferase [Ligilactobacillus agilis]MBL1056154.1 glycosyltransferase [Ligilactobacillus agilis]
MSEISVIMGVYNCRNFSLLKQSIDSIINQTFEDWELIICDDGSTDGTYQELIRLATKDSRIKIIHYEKNRGLAYALNECIKQSNGKYIARQDDDDISLPTRLEKEIEFLKHNVDIDMVGTNASVYNDEGVWGKYLVPHYPSINDFLWNNPFIHPTIMIRKDKLLGVTGYRVAKETRRCEDYDLFMRLYAKGYKGANLQEYLYKYRIENNSIKKRPMKYRIDEMIVRYKNYKNLKLGIRAYPYIVKPIILGLIPQSIFRIIRKKVY